MTHGVRHQMLTPTFWAVAWLAFLATISAIFVLWYVVFFTPVVSVSSGVTVNGRYFEFDNWSYKTWMANTLCGKPLNPGTVVVFVDEHGNDANVNDNASGQGNGTREITKWESSGEIPALIRPGFVTVHKRLLYLCAGGLVKTSRSAEHTFRLME